MSEATEIDTVRVPGFPWPTWRERPYAEIASHEFLWMAWTLFVVLSDVLALVFEIIGVVAVLRWVW